MAKNVIMIVVVAFVLSLLITVHALCFAPTRFDNALRLTAELASWEVIGGLLAAGGGSTFATEIRAALCRATDGNHPHG